MVSCKIITFFYLIIPFAASLSFNFSSFITNDPNVTYEKSAYAADNIIQLTRNRRDASTLASVGRATYAKPMHLWDKSSKNLTDFTTTFSFVINSLNRSAYGDGMVFFLAPAGSRIPDNVTKGRSMGLATDNQPLNSTDNPFVAVEFDVYPNHFDPPGEHVGIDINSMESVANITWLSASSIMKGLKHEASINYDSGSKNLSVVFTGYRNDNYITQRLSYIVDLRQYLPEWVTFGFSAATGNASALHSIYSWSFSSTLEVNETDPGVVDLGPTNGTDPWTVKPGSNSSKNKIGLVIGFAVGGSVLAGGLGIFGCWKKRRRMLGEGGSDFDVEISDEFERGSGPKKFSYALLYLHEEWEQCVVHRDIKSSNVMLDSNFNAKLGDFGLARLVDHEKGSHTTVLAGTMGYMALECVITGKASKETDVYSFGVVALEIACGRRPIDPKAQEDQVNLVERVWGLYGTGKLLEAADSKLDSDFNVQELEHLMIVGLWCAHPDSDLRPSIRQALLVLKFEAPLPILPSRMPVPMYCNPIENMLSSGTVTSQSRDSQPLSSISSDNTESSKVTASSGASSPSASLLYTI
ncbi:unnamed protein product [Fraxinus pennsylvanica]|uniref:Protein kinase domain-containing protein n=1 Tax=Fraxinus pennsylvanica TaxID=56036 RepID=A0AAD1Z8U9_9LAMI|nr:unnamed protein product [Fraxinus pennsylvanica]